MSPPPGRRCGGGRRSGLLLGARVRAAQHRGRSRFARAAHDPREGCRGHRARLRPAAAGVAARPPAQVAALAGAPAHTSGDPRPRRRRRLLSAVRGGALRARCRGAVPGTRDRTAAHRRGASACRTNIGAHHQHGRGLRHRGVSAPRLLRPRRHRRRQILDRGQGAGLPPESRRDRPARQLLHRQRREAAVRLVRRSVGRWLRAGGGAAAGTVLVAVPRPRGLFLCARRGTAAHLHPRQLVARCGRGAPGGVAGPPRAAMAGTAGPDGGDGAGNGGCLLAAALPVLYHRHLHRPGRLDGGSHQGSCRVGGAGILGLRRRMGCVRWPGRTRHRERLRDLGPGDGHRRPRPLPRGTGSRPRPQLTAVDRRRTRMALRGRGRRSGRHHGRERTAADLQRGLGHRPGPCHGAVESGRVPVESPFAVRRQVARARHFTTPPSCGRSPCARSSPATGREGLLPGGPPRRATRRRPHRRRPCPADR